MPTLYQIILIALFSAFVELFMSKSGVRYWLRDQCDDIDFTIIAKMLDCDFCLGFWLSVIISIAMVLITLDPSYIYVPLFATPIIRFLV
jgi:hypothetical protein